MSALGAVLTVFCLLFVLAPGFCTINHNLTPTKQTHANQIQRQRQGCDSRTRGNHARGLKNSLHAVFTRYLRGNHVRYIYGIVLKYTVNTGESVFFLVVGGRRVFKFRVWCACLSLYSLFLSSRPFLPPCACAFSCSVHRHGPWLCAYRQVRNVTENFE